MIRFTCPNCAKGLRADDSKAGSLVKCPACGHKLTIPDAEIEQPPEEEVPERPAPRQKKRQQFRARSPDASRGRVLVIIICGVVLGMHLVSLIKYLATPDPVEVARKQTREIYQKVGQDLPKDFEDKMMGGKEMRATLRWGQIMSLLWLLGSFSVSAVLLTFLYLRHDWARIVLGILFLIGAGLGLLGLMMLLGGMATLRFLGAGAAVLTFLESLVQLGVNLGIGLTLMKSEGIAAYTGGRRSDRAAGRAKRGS
jgi:DNA-directed RNA polymerase subunit RPC12/RpoP